ncbi:MAG: NUDIX hydrolase [Dermatophilus congolensis]|nr:NUDIX hydrolase [Dermatophilus congolensis]
MTLDAGRLSVDEMRDEFGRRPVLEETQIFDGFIFGVARAQVDLGVAGVVNRDYMTHPGAVAVVALRPGPDGDDEVLVIQQYRHAIGVRSWELPAGLLDMPGEPPWEAAARELAEEADLVASTWHVLGGFAPSTGASTEAIRIFLARDLADVPGSERHEREGEEADIRAAWVSLTDLHEAVLRDRFVNAPLVMGILAAAAARDRDWVPLQPHDTPWPQHPAYR